MKVLQMVASGQITVQDADLLLRAMGAADEVPAPAPPPAPASGPLDRDPVQALKAAVAADLDAPDWAADLPLVAPPAPPPPPKGSWVDRIADPVSRPARPVNPLKAVPPVPPIPPVPPVPPSRRYVPAGAGAAGTALMPIPSTSSGCARRASISSATMSMPALSIT